MFQARFKVPSYYKDFHCKGKQCRNCCCQGWKVTLTQDEYFKILNENCSKELKEKIDTYVGILPHPTMEEYARIYFDYTGQCPLRLNNGYCGLQVECGEENIASVCRYYPRAPHLYPSPECSISDSCEAVLEKLVDPNYHFTFEERELSFAFDDTEVKEKYPSDYQDVRKNCFLLMQDEKKNLLEKLQEENDFLGDDRKVEDAFIIKNLKMIFARSISIGEDLRRIPDNFISFEECYQQLKEIYSDFDSMVSKIVLNHFLYIRYPYVDKNIELFWMPNILREVLYFWFLILFYNLSKRDRDDFVDITGTFFRVSEHSNLYQVIEFLLKKNHKTL